MTGVQTCALPICFPVTIGEAVLISVEQFEKFVEAEEELEDIRAAEESMRDPSPNIPWEKVKKELGLK